MVCARPGDAKSNVAGPGMVAEVSGGVRATGLYDIKQKEHSVVQPAQVQDDEARQATRCWCLRSDKNTRRQMSVVASS